MGSFRLLSCLLIFLPILVINMGTTPVLASITVDFDKEVHFLTPDGKDLVHRNKGHDNIATGRSAQEFNLNGANNNAIGYEVVGRGGKTGGKTGGKKGSSTLRTPTMPGEVVITEVMVDPSRVSDTAGEWFEVYNPTNSDLELKDQIVTDGGAQHFTISRSLVIPAGGFLVLGNNGDKKTNGGVPVAFVYTGFTLANAGDAIQIMNSTTTIDSVRYDASFGVTAGRAISLDPRAFNTTANDTGTNWCAAVLQMPGGDFGSPGSLNPQLPVTWYWTQRKTTTHPKTGQVANTQTSYFPGGMTAQAAYQFWSVIPINDGTQESNETVQFRGIGSSGYCINNTLSASGVFSIVNSGPATNPFRMNSNHDILEAF